MDRLTSMAVIRQGRGSRLLRRGRRRAGAFGADGRQACALPGGALGRAAAQSDDKTAEPDRFRPRLCYERCRIVLSEVEAADALAAEQRSEPPRGRLRVAMSVHFGRRCA